ncbi:hypothetical protein EU538_10670 [Candidatus Thorarchaeota archaeon]|nr:MAG: hypothetical protein EU538_10670 [Candidatus Thorarchaeota archaeon]
MTLASRRQIPVFFLVVSLVAMLCQPMSARSLPLAIDEYQGPYLDEVQLNWFSGEEAIDALMNNEIDLIANPTTTEAAAALEHAEDIETVRHLQNGKGYMVINCEKYPFNITAFRRALAFAVDKERIAADAWEGWAEPLDSLIPTTNPFSVEGDLDYSYYDANIERAEMLLDGAEFLDVDDDGFRETPDENALHVLIEVPESSSTLIEVGEIIAEGLSAVHINATLRPTDFYEYLTRYYFCGDFDLIFLSRTFSSLDVSWLAYEYWPEYVEDPCALPLWRNQSYDSWREQLLYSLDYQEVYEAAIKMQEVWVYESPEIVLYQRILPYAHRTDRFSGFVDEPLDSIGGWWTCLRTHLTRSGHGVLGGTLRVGLPHTTPQFNIMIAAGAASYDFPYLHLMYDSLLRRGPDGNGLSWLAESYVVETHDDDRSVAEGTTRFTFDIRTDVTWTDGSRLTASDIVAALNFYRVSPGNPLGEGMSHVYAAYTLSSSRLVVDVNQVSYWGRYAFCLKPILPQSLLEDLEPEDWVDWDPQPPEERMITSGPFNVSAVESEYLSLSHNPDCFTRKSFVPPEIKSPPDAIITAGSTNRTISWNCTDSDPFSYAVFRNGSLMAQNEWTGGVIEISLDDLEVGVHNFTCVVEDEVGLISSDTVWVRVESVDSTTGVRPPPEWLLPLGPVSLGITAIALAIIIVFGSAIVKNRQVL